MKNCGQTVHDEVANKQTMEELKELLKVSVLQVTSEMYSADSSECGSGGLQEVRVGVMAVYPESSVDPGRDLQAHVLVLLLQDEKDTSFGTGACS